MRKGFTLIELMIVIVILGLLAALVMPNLIGQSEQAKKKIACIQMKTINDALKTFKLKYGKYPSTEQGLKALVKNPNPSKFKDYPKDGFLDSKKVPVDPWGNRYVYMNDEGNINIVSLGADGKEGGTGENADISYEECRK